MFFLRDWTRDDDADADAVEFKILERIRAAGKKIENKTVPPIKSYAQLSHARLSLLNSLPVSRFFSVFVVVSLFWLWIGVIFERACGNASDL